MKHICNRIAALGYLVYNRLCGLLLSLQYSLVVDRLVAHGLPFCHGAGQVWLLAVVRHPEPAVRPLPSRSMENGFHSRVVP